MIEETIFKYVTSLSEVSEMRPGIVSRLTLVDESSGKIPSCTHELERAEVLICNQNTSREWDGLPNQMGQACSCPLCSPQISRLEGVCGFVGTGHATLP